MRSSTLPLSSTENCLLFSKTFHSSLNLSIAKPSPPPPPKPPRQSLKTKHFSRRIQLKPDVDGRFGFNIKVNDASRSRLSFSRRFQRDENHHQSGSILISKIARNTPASRAKLRQGDSIFTINHIDISKHTHEEIVNIIRNSRELELEISVENSMEESLDNFRHRLSAEEFEVQRHCSTIFEDSIFSRDYLVEKKRLPSKLPVPNRISITIVIKMFYLTIKRVFF